MWSSSRVFRSRRPVIVVAAVVAMVVAGAVPAYAAAGDLDTGFDSDGKVTTQMGSGISVANAVVYDGTKVVVAGRAGGAAVDGAVGLARYNSDGTLDTTFGTSGKVITDFSSLTDLARDILLQTVGTETKYLVGGLANSEPAGDFLLARYNHNGTLDTTFGTSSGYTRTDISGVGDGIRGLAMDANGKIIAVGAAGSDSALVRYNSNGTLDTGFDGDGIVLSNAGVGDHFFNIALDGNGKYVVGGATGNSDSDFLVARYNTDGTLDTGFDGDGRAFTGFTSGDSDLAFDLVVNTSTNKIIVVGNTGAVDLFGVTVSKFALAKYDANGSLDTSFDTDGKVTTDLTTTPGASADGIRGAILINNKVTVAGFCGEAHGITSFLDPTIGDFCLARYNAGDGSLDTSFSGDGTLVTDFAGGGDGVRAIAPNGTNDRVTVVGGANSPTDLDFALVRYVI